MSILRSPATRRTAVVNWFSPPKGCVTVNSENTAPRLTVPRVAVCSLLKTAWPGCGAACGVLFVTNPDSRL